MNLEWLNKSAKNRRLIVFFSGWGVNSSLVSHLNCTDYDVLYVDDYRTFEAIPEIDQYDQRYLIAWSFGVASFSIWHAKYATSTIFDKQVAINGSCHPVDRGLGIPPKVMQLTIDTLNENSLIRFHRRCGITNQLKETKTTLLSIAALKTELESIRDRKHPVSLNWYKVIISENDRIMSPENIERAWRSTAFNNTAKATLNISKINAPHSPFSAWSSWSKILT